MNALTDRQLLRDYAEHHSEAAFAELVRRHVDLVHSAALRMVNESHAAEDVTQTVFLALAQNAARLSEHPVLSGWLHATARHLAAKSVRAAVRRQLREQEASAMNHLLSAENDVPWESLASHLDACLGELNEAERDALLLRYFEKKSAPEMAALLGISSSAAQKRVSRAMERLRDFFAQRGVTISAGGLAVAISANAVHAAPAALAVTISATALSGTAIITTAAIATTKAIAMTTLQKTVVTAVFAIVAGAGIYEASQVSRLRDENQNLIARQEELSHAHEAALSAATATKDELERLKKNQSELLRLRSEVGELRRQSKELEKIRQENRQLLSSMSSAVQPPTAMPLPEPELPFPGAGTKVPPPSEWVRVKISDSGEIFVNKKLVSLREFATECERLKQVGGAARIYIDTPDNRPLNPAQTNALHKLVNAGVPMKAELKEGDLEGNDP